MGGPQEQERIYSRNERRPFALLIALRKEVPGTFNSPCTLIFRAEMAGSQVWRDPTMKVALLRLALILALIQAAAIAQSPGEAKLPTSGEPLVIGNQVQLFVDDYFIDSMQGLHLMLQKPEPAGVAIRFDKPWEGNTSAYVTVFRDGDKYRMYYRGAAAPDYARKSALKPGEVLYPAHRDVTCYAESNDGITWTKPSLGMVEFDGSRDNNIVFDGGEASANFSPFLDKNPDVPSSQRYKAVGGDAKGLFAFESSDGLHWKKMSEQRVITDGAFDSLNVAFWDTIRQDYVLIYRAYLQGVRTFKRATSKDFIHWTKGEWADFGRAPLEQLYTNAATPYFRAPQIYLAFPKRYVPYRRVHEDDPRHDGVSEAVFMSSRDGIHWDRRFMEAFVRPGLDPLDWVHRDHMIGTGLLQTGPDELSFFISRHYTFPSAFIERMTMRLDGFVSVHADYWGGTLTTKPFIFDGNKLVLNYSTSAVGSIQWELLDMNGNPFPGLSFEQTKPLSGDEVAHVIDIPVPHHLEVRPLRLHFRMRDADLYSIQIRK